MSCFVERRTVHHAIWINHVRQHRCSPVTTPVVHQDVSWRWPASRKDALTKILFLDPAYGILLTSPQCTLQYKIIAIITRRIEFMLTSSRSLRGRPSLLAQAQGAMARKE